MEERRSFDIIRTLVDKSEHTKLGDVRWQGSERHNDLQLMTDGGGRRIVMDFSRWGMNRGQPRFQRNGVMYDAKNFLVHSGRDAIIDVDHEDAQLIAAIFAHGANLVRYVEHLERLAYGHQQQVPA